MEATCFYTALLFQADSNSSKVADADCFNSSDLRLSLDNFLSSKKVAPPTATAPTLSNPQMNGLPSQSLPLPSAPLPTAMAHVTAAARSEPVEVTVDEIELAPPTVSEATLTDMAHVSNQENLPPAGSFGGLSNEFLSGMQVGLEGLGYDLTSDSIMQQLVNDSGLPERLVSHLASMMGVPANAILIEMIRQWQKALAEQIEEELALKKLNQRPVWRCAVCGRYGCPVAPYIESYQEIEE